MQNCGHYEKAPLDRSAGLVWEGDEQGGFVTGLKQGYVTTMWQIKRLGQFKIFVLVSIRLH